MNEWSRIVIEQYCSTHYSQKADFLARMVEMSYDVSAVGTDADAIRLQQLIHRERSPELKDALQDLDDFLFRY
ncbi:MAG: hypothetical protein LKE64_03045 [Solobacterium sp.]|jgi:hypothetical protein|nr:hypothetical protein [Solobacterium sp.]MCH4049580.1 hypothetical protein [Solobacterium sp.]MCH4073266.1 hypothetical protein [Solobacterium sp.]MCI1313076.1 hypothetical protein [Solobacterium sp.]MCI1345494.1 hypothetical protein [Solobacterium sp.]